MNGKKKGVSGGWGCGERGRHLSPLSPLSVSKRKCLVVLKKGSALAGVEGCTSLQHTPRGGRSVRGSPVKGKIQRNAED